LRFLDHFQLSDKFEHLLAYAALAFLPAIHERKALVVAATVGAVALGVALEFGQLFLGWRDFEIADMIADTVGVGLGLASGIKMRSTDVLRSVFSSE
jgi:VanZ family protein